MTSEVRTATQIPWSSDVDAATLPWLTVVQMAEVDRAMVEDCIGWTNALSVPVLALDVPSGLERAQCSVPSSRPRPR